MRVRDVMRLWVAVVLIVMLPGAWAASDENLPDESGFGDPATLPLWTPAQRAALQALCLPNDAPGHAAWVRIRDQADAALAVAPNPPRRVIYEGRLPDDPERVASIARLHGVSRIRALGLAWLVTDDARYADHARATMLAWARTYQPTGNAINEHKLSSLHGTYGLLRDQFSAEERAEIEAWQDRIFRQLRRAAERHGARGNWQAKRLKLAALIGVSGDNAEAMAWARAGLIAYIDTQLHGDGSSEDFRRRDALSYHCGGLKPMLELAMVLDAAADEHDWYRHQADDGASLANAVAFLVSYVDGTREHAEWVDTQVELDRQRAAAGHAHYQPGRIYQPPEALETLELASAFDPDLQALIDRIRVDAGISTALTWPQVVIRARQAR